MNDTGDTFRGGRRGNVGKSMIPTESYRNRDRIGTNL